MGNPFQDQLLKAGIASKKQVHKAKQEKNQQRKKQRSGKEKVVDENKLQAQQAALDKTKRDRELNKVKQDQARQKAIAAEVNQLIVDNCITRDDDCELVYNFQHHDKVKRLYLNTELKKQLAKGLLGIAEIDGRYELVTKTVAEKIKQRDSNRVVTYEAEVKTVDENDPYAGYEVPDDLDW